MVLKDSGGRARGPSSFGAVTQTVNYRQQRAMRQRRHDIAVAGLVPVEGSACPGPFENGIRQAQGGAHASHFLSVTVVPTPTADSSVKSSTSRRAPGSPNPRLL